MASRFRRKSLHELKQAGDRWTSGVVVFLLAMATYGLVDKLGG